MSAIRFGLVLVVSVAVALPARAVQVTLAWDANIETDLAGYRLYYDVDSGDPYEGNFADQGSSPVEVPLDSLDDPELPQVTLTGVPSCTHVFFAVTAYDTAGLESDYSDEIDAVLVETPADVTVETGTDGALVVSWAGDEDGTADYLVHYGFESGSPYEGTGADQGDSPVVASSESSLTLTGLPAGMETHVAVEAVCASGETAISGEIVGTTGGVMPEDGGPSDDGGDGVDDGAPIGDAGGDSGSEEDPAGGDPIVDAPTGPAPNAPAGLSYDSLVVEGGCAAAPAFAAPVALVLIWAARRRRG